MSAAADCPQLAHLACPAALALAELLDAAGQVPPAEFLAEAVQYDKICPADQQQHVEKCPAESAVQPVLKMNVPALETKSAWQTVLRSSVRAVFMQKMLFVAVLLCDFYANCADIMQIVLFLCKL